MKNKERRAMYGREDYTHTKPKKSVKEATKRPGFIEE